MKILVSSARVKRGKAKPLSSAFNLKAKDSEHDATEDEEEETKVKRGRPSLSGEVNARTTVITFRLTNKQCGKLDRLAKQHSMSRSEVMRILIDQA